MGTDRLGRLYGCDPGDEVRHLRADQADRDADRRDAQAEQSANAAEDRDRDAAQRDRAAADRQRGLLAGPDRHAADHPADDIVGAELGAADREPVEADREERKRMIADAAGLDVDALLDKLNSCYRRWQAVRHELHDLADDRAAAAEDRRRAVEDRDTAHRARSAGATDRARSAADRDQGRQNAWLQHHNRSEPAVLRRALSYITDHADEDIGVTDIARHARIGVRGLQTVFSTHHDCPPLEQLRRERIVRAHVALQAADPTRGETVAAIAARCWFTNPGRFAGQYRKVYGCSPSTTLRH